MLSKELNLLAEHQEEMVKKDEWRAYQGLCQQEAALLWTHAKDTVDADLKKEILVAANEALTRAIKVDIMLHAEV